MIQSILNKKHLVTKNTINARFKETEAMQNVSLALYNKACNGGYAPSCIYLGRLYRDSRKVAPDYEKAKEKFSLACEANNYLGCKELRILQELERSGYSTH